MMLEINFFGFSIISIGLLSLNFKTQNHLDYYASCKILKFLILELFEIKNSYKPFCFHFKLSPKIVISFSFMEKSSYL